ncbi:PorV/PorQ family protein [candidate division WOR-3 bacterium]|nr:PorV/PorQ family protein [candidate division WOR-3 bacterium]
MRKFIFILFLIIAFSASGEVTKVGTTAAPFLTIPVGPRALGMGGAFVSIADDATAMFWNVAGIGKLTHIEAVLIHTNWIFDTYFEYAGVIIPVPGLGTFGANFTYMNLGEMEQTTEADPDGNDIKFSCGSFSFGLAFARQLTDRFSIGINAKYIQENIMNCSATGFAIDIGTLFRTQFKDARLGLSISNFGTKMQMAGNDLLVQHDIEPGISGNNPYINAFLSTGSFDLPLILRVGLSIDLINTPKNLLTLSCDALHPNDNTESLNIGTEYVFNNLISLRAGYKAIYRTDSEEGFTFGVGLSKGFPGFLRFKVDYAYELFGRLNDVQKFGVAMEF